jgi:hypothetical protein
MQESKERGEGVGWGGWGWEETEREREERGSGRSTRGKVWGGAGKERRMWAEENKKGKKRKEKGREEKGRKEKEREKEKKRKGGGEGPANEPPSAASVPLRFPFSLPSTLCFASVVSPVCILPCPPALSYPPCVILLPCCLAACCHASRRAPVQLGCLRGLGEGGSAPVLCR